MQQSVTQILDVGTKQLGVEVTSGGTSHATDSSSQEVFNQLYHDAQRQNQQRQPERQTHANEQSKVNNNNSSESTQKTVSESKKQSTESTENHVEKATEAGPDEKVKAQNEAGENGAEQDSKSVDKEISLQADFDPKLTDFVENLLHIKKLADEGDAEFAATAKVDDENMSHITSIAREIQTLVSLDTAQINELEEKISQLGNLINNQNVTPEELDKLADKFATLLNELSQLVIKVNPTQNKQPLVVDEKALSSKLEGNLKALLSQEQLSKESAEFKLFEKLKNAEGLQQLFVGTTVDEQGKSPILGQLLTEKFVKPQVEAETKVTATQSTLVSEKLALLDKLVAGNETLDTKEPLSSFAMNNAKGTSDIVNKEGLDTATSASINKLDNTQLQKAPESNALTKNLGTPLNINKPEFQQALSERIHIMVNSRIQVADMRLDPPELGAMQVRINMNSESAAVSIVVQSQQAKDALDQAIPRLKDLLAQQGIELGESSIQKESKQNDGMNGESNDGETLLAEEQSLSEEELIEQGLTARVTNGALGGIDFYA